MATKKATKAKAPKAPKAPKASKAPSSPKYDYEALLQLRREMDLAHSEVRVAERVLRSAQSINTAAHRDAAVADARARLAVARQEASEATERFQAMKYQGSGNRR